MIDLDTLEKLARAATPGKWRFTSYGFVEARSGHVCQLWDKTEEDFANHEANAAHIAANSPDVVLKLIEVARKAQELLGSIDDPSKNSSTEPLEAALSALAGKGEA